MANTEQAHPPRRAGHFEFAPWVAQSQHAGNLLLLGPKLQLLRADPRITADILQFQGHSGFVVEAGFPAGAAADKRRDAFTNLSHDDRHALQPGQRDGRERPRVALLDLTARRAATLLEASFESRRRPAVVLPPTWLAEPFPIPDGLPVMVVSDHECLAVPEWLPRLMQRHPVLWSGECEDGTHVGPLLRSPAEAGRYFEATMTWSSARRLVELGFRHRPLPLLTDGSRAVAVADAAARFLPAPGELETAVDSPDSTAILVDQQRPVSLWTLTRTKTVTEEELLRQAWSKGLMRNLRVFEKEAPGAPVYFASCLTPTGGLLAQLEAASGKARSRELALTRATGEAVERFSAWNANNLPRSSRRGARRLPLDGFHPCGPLYDVYLDSPAVQVEYVSGSSLTRGDVVEIPLALVAFPYTPPRAMEPRPTWATTGGLAVYPSRSEAVLRGLREILERDCLYPDFLWHRPAKQLALPGELAELEHVGDRRWHLLTYDNAPVPIVHAFVFEGSGPGLRAARGSGSGLTWNEAAHCAIEEAEQIMCQIRRPAPGHMGAGFRSWARPEVAEAVLAYVAAQPPGTPGAAESASAEQQLEETLTDLERSSREVVVVDLPCPVQSWSAVRVLVPGATVHQHASRSQGGRRLLSAPWQHGLPG